MKITTATTATELQQIIDLQRANLHRTVGPEEAQSQGYVTVEHDLSLLQKMNDTAPHIIAKSDDQLAGYCLAMCKAFRQDIPVLVPLFDLIDQQYFHDKQLQNANYIVCGQVCVDKAFRGQGIFDKMYHAFQQKYAAKYDFLLTEIAVKNTRSRRAHYRVGFQELLRYTTQNEHWEIVLWDWQNQ